MRYEDLKFASSKRSDQKDWGWHVLVSDSKEGSISGSLINSRWVLSQAALIE
jgi:hypothetical protein